MTDNILNRLINNIQNTNENKSSYWKQHLNNKSNFISEYEHLNFGSYTKKSYKNFIHIILQYILFGNKLFKTQTYKEYKNNFDLINRFIDLDTIRHILTFEKLKKLIQPKSVCIIGDGKINGVLGAYLTFKNVKIYSVNLSETLINDYKILKSLNNELSKSLDLIDNSNFYFSDKMLHLIPSNFKNILYQANIDLFINISSFQEMTINEIDEYFKIIKKNKSKLYCCNREYKKLYAGEEIYFDKYPWEDYKKIFWENTPWAQKFYSTKFPFIHKYHGNIKHCLVDFGLKKN